MKTKYFKLLAFRFAFLTAISAILFLVIGVKSDLNLIHFFLLLLFFVVSFLFFRLFTKKIDEYNSAEFQKKIKKLEKEIKHGNIDEWTKKKTKEIAQLKANEQFRKEFIGNVAHELKTPIFNIQGYIATLLEGAIDDSEVNMKYLERTDKNTQRLITIVKDLDTISKIETGAVIPEMQEFDLVIVINEVLEILETSSKESGVSLIFNETKEIFVKADKEKITEVIHNLVLNSIIYGSENGQTEIIIKEKKKKIIVNIKDNGIGIDEKNLVHIFERFFRVDKSRSREMGGSGLGLAIVKHIIDSHNQTITVDSKVGVGTTFTFSLSKQ